MTNSKNRQEELVELFNEVLAKEEIEFSEVSQSDQKTINDLCKIIKILTWRVESGPYGFSHREIEDLIKESIKE